MDTCFKYKNSFLPARHKIMITYIQDLFIYDSILINIFKVIFFTFKKVEVKSIFHNDENGIKKELTYLE